MKLMKFSASVAIAASLLVVSGPTTQARAATLLDVGGVADATVNLLSGVVHGTTFTVSETILNWSLTAPILCLGLGSTCAGQVLLHQGTLGPAASLTGLIDGLAISGADFDFEVTALTGGRLDPGDYTLFASFTSGIAGWSAGSAPVRTGGVAATDSLDVNASSAAGYLPQSSFSVILSDFSAFYALTGDRVAPPPPPPPPIGEVPLPAGGWMLLGAMAALAGLRRRASRAA